VKLPLAMRSLRHRNYRLFFSGQLISLSGTWMQTVAQSWLVYRLTGSAVLLGIVGFAGQLPTLLFSPAGGLVADRFDRRRLLIATQAAAMALAFALAALTLSGRVTVTWILTLAALMGVTNGFDIPVRQAFAVDMVGKEDLVNAIALNSSVFNGARVVGPAIAGVLVAKIGEGWCFFVNAVSYLAVLAGLVAMRDVRARARASVRSPLDSLREGFGYVGRARPIRALLLLLGLVSFSGMPFAVLMPVFATKVLGGDARTLGGLMAASGVGALAGAAVLATRTTLAGLGRFVALSAGALGVALFAFSFSRSVALSALLLVPVGFFLMSQMASTNTLIQSLVADELRGRVMSVYAMMFMGMAPLGALAAGTLAAHVGAPATVAAGGVACVAGAAVFSRRIPSLSEEARAMLATAAAPTAIPGDPTRPTAA
jgi:MFS family permease